MNYNYYVKQTKAPELKQDKFEYMDDFNEADMNPSAEGGTKCKYKI